MSNDSDRELETEIKQLADELLAIDDEHVIDTAAILAREFRERIKMIHALRQVEAMTQEDIVSVETRSRERLQRAREEIRDGLEKLLDWAEGRRRSHGAGGR